MQYHTKGRLLKFSGVQFAMSNVEIECRGFSSTYAHLNGMHNLNITSTEVFRGIVSLGLEKFDNVDALDWRRWMHRFGMGLSAFAFLEERNTGLFVADEFRHLDPSEKGMVSYWYGMSFAKIVAESVLNIPWLRHVDGLIEAGVLTTTSNSRERGDLVGLTPNIDWHVIEAKGRSKKYSRAIVEGAKRQAARVNLINGTPPNTASACVTSLLFNSAISIVFEDPKPRKELDPERWTIDQTAYLMKYYSGVKRYLGLFEQREEYSSLGHLFITAPLIHPFLLPPFGPSNLRVGLLSTIFENPANARSAVSELPRDVYNIGRDGIAIFGTLPD